MCGLAEQTLFLVSLYSFRKSGEALAPSPLPFPLLCCPWECVCSMLQETASAIPEQIMRFSRPAFLDSLDQVTQNQTPSYLDLSVSVSIIF